MFEKEKKKNQGGEWSEEEWKEGREEPKYCFSFFLITILINEEYFRFSHLLMYFLYKFTIIFVKSSLNHENHIFSDICANILKLVA